MAETKMQLVDWLDDLCVRFIINVPKEELESVERICFQIEEAQWFYEDFIRPLDPTLPSLNLKQFCLAIFQHCPLFAGFSQDQHFAAFSEFLSYKTRVPVRGAIMLNEAMDEVVLVKGWKKGANWSFPRGKINKDENDLDCAVREVYEETGFDIGAAGLIPSPSNVKFIEVTMREQHMKLFVFTGVPMDTVFQPRTRKEISKIQWYKLVNLPGYNKKLKQGLAPQETVTANKLYMVAPFLGPLKKWINQQRRQVGQRASHGDFLGVTSGVEEPETDGNFTADEDTSLMRQLFPERGPEPVPMPVPMATSSVSQPNPADELKRLLAVQPSKSPQSLVDQPVLPSTDASSLLSLLQGKSHPAQASVSNPQTLVDQILAQPSAPEVQNYHQSRPADVSNTRPSPAIPTPPQHQPGQRIDLLDAFRQNLSSPPGLPHTEIHQPVASTHQQTLLNVFRQGPQQQDLHSFGSPQTGSVLPLPQTRGSTNTDYIGRGAIGSVVRKSSFPQTAPEQNVPPASDLPTPKIGGHAQNLLGLFKAKEQRSSSQTSTRGSLSFQPSSLAPRRKDSTTSSRQGGDSFGVASPDLPADVLTVTELPAVASPLSSPTATLPMPASQVTTHQNSLLSLLKMQSPAPSREPRTPRQSISVTSVPVEIGGARTPRVEPAEMPVPFPVEATKLESPHSTVETPRISILQRPKSLEASKPPQNSSQPTNLKQAPKPTSATLSSPPNMPDLNSARRKGSQRRPKKSVETPSGDEAQKTTPIQILKRPQEPVVFNSKPEEQASPRIEPRPSTPSKAARFPKANGSKPATPKPFQPQILKRPQQSPSPASPLSGVSKRTSDAADQRQALLALLGGVSRPSQNTNPSSTTSDLLQDIVSPAAGLSMSRISSQASGSADLGPSRLSNPVSVPKENIGSSPQTPISNADRGFLLNYLDNVVKGAR